MPQQQQQKHGGNHYVFRLSIHLSLSCECLLNSLRKWPNIPHNIHLDLKIQLWHHKTLFKLQINHFYATYGKI